MKNPESTGLWADADIVAPHTRAQAIEDGVLVDVSDTAREAGFRVSVAVTHAVATLLTPSEADSANGQSLAGRLWDTLMLLRANARETDTILFEVIVAP